MSLTACRKLNLSTIHLAIMPTEDIATKQSVWIIRYGLTKHPLVENLGPFDGEFAQRFKQWPPHHRLGERLSNILFFLTGDICSTEGVDHAKCIARKIAASGTDAPKFVYSSPFLRTAHTAQLVALDTAKPCVRIEEGMLIHFMITSLDMPSCNMRFSLPP